MLRHFGTLFVKVEAYGEVGQTTTEYASRVVDKVDKLGETLA